MGKKYKLFPFRVVFCLIALVPTIFQLSDSNLVSNESNKESFGGRLIVLEYDGYEGVPKHAKSDLDMKELGAKGRFVELLFEIRLEKGLEYNGAYLDYLPPQMGELKPKEFDNSSYSFMFGLDKCGSKNKFHFVLKHKNPTSGEYIEHHLKSPLTIPSDEMCHVCTAILKPNNDLVILIDGKQKKHANFLNGDDFEPPLLIPAKTISYPNNEKPVDRDERAKVLDPEVVKPGYSETPKCKSPIRKSVFGWCERENPSNVWNPVHRGKCHLPPIDNPNYNGTWKAKEIPNPVYNEHKKPHFEPIVAVGSKSCTMGDVIKKKILDLLYKLVDFLKKCKCDVKLTPPPNITVASVTICYEQFCFSL